MEQISVSKLGKLSTRDYKRLGSFEITSDGEVIAVVAVVAGLDGATGGFLADSVRELCVQSEAVRVREEEVAEVSQV